MSDTVEKKDDGLVVANSAMDNMARLFNMAKYMVGSSMLPECYKTQGDVFLALETAQRLNMSTMAVFQNLYIVKGRPEFKGSFCRALVNQNFKNVQIVSDGSFAKGNFKSIALKAKDKNGNDIETTLTKETIEKFGWIKNTMWLNMPDQMAVYRVSAFFLRSHAPELLCGAMVEGESLDVKEAETVYDDKAVPVDPKAFKIEPKNSKPEATEDPKNDDIPWEGSTENTTDDKSKGKQMDIF